MQPSSQPHAGFFESDDAIPAQFLAHAQTFDRGGSYLVKMKHENDHVDGTHNVNCFAQKLVLTQRHTQSCKKSLNDNFRSFPTVNCVGEFANHLAPFRKFWNLCLRLAIGSQPLTKNSMVGKNRLHRG